MSDNIIRIENGKLIVPNKPVMPFIEGDGIGPDIWAAAVRVFDAAVEKAYGGERKIQWLEVLAAKRRSTKRVRGFPRKRSTLSENIWSASRARSQRPSAAASARSTLRFGRSLTSMSASAPCAISAASTAP